ncbi:hypothetical protein Goshw_026394, partial [Gossypium schwendimanii]|nr:hypothetical protein [Gossypium schwendimanii]
MDEIQNKGVTEILLHVPTHQHIPSWRIPFEAQILHQVYE